MLPAQLPSGLTFFDDGEEVEVGLTVELDGFETIGDALLDPVQSPYRD